jgi:anti-anti-sigma regulatory factor
VNRTRVGLGIDAASAVPASRRRRVSRAYDGEETTVPMQWRFEVRGPVGIVFLSGTLTADDCDRFAGAVGWALTTGGLDAVVVDVGQVVRWSTEGREALADAAERLAPHGRRLALCDPQGPAGPALEGMRCWRIPVFADLDSATAALVPPPPPT